MNNILSNARWFFTATPVGQWLVHGALVGGAAGLSFLALTITGIGIDPTMGAALSGLIAGWARFLKSKSGSVEIPTDIPGATTEVNNGIR